jgi:hypothetical protein
LSYKLIVRKYMFFVFIRISNISKHQFWLLDRLLPKRLLVSKTIKTQKQLQKGKFEYQCDKRNFQAIFAIKSTLEQPRLRNLLHRKSHIVLIIL